MSNMTAETLAYALLAGWISRFGVPNTIMSDRGCAQLEPTLWSSLMTFLGIKRNRTTANHRQVKSHYRTLPPTVEKALMAHVNGPHMYDELHTVMLGIQSAYKDNLRYSSAELTYGTTLRPPGEFCHRTIAPWPTTGSNI